MTNMDWAKLAQTADDAGKPIDDGVYPVKISKCEAVSASTGAPMLKLIVDIQGDQGDATGKKVWTQTTLTVDNGFALRRWFAFLEAFGITRDWLTATDATIDMIAMALVGRYAQAKVFTEPYKNQPRNKIDEWMPYDTPLQPSLPDSSQLAMAAVADGSTAAGGEEIVF